MHNGWMVGRLGFELFLKISAWAKKLLLAITQSFQADHRVSVCSFIQLCRWFGAPTGLPPLAWRAH
jgi:hypothetical protein